MPPDQYNIEGHFARIAVLIGDKARSVMLWNLLDGRAYTAYELALCADVSPQSASNHLAKLVEGKLLSVARQGRHRYYRLAGADVAKSIESIASLVPAGTRTPKQPAKNDFTFARTCYDHVAGELGVKVTEAMMKKRLITLKDELFLVSIAGNRWFSEHGIDVPEIKKDKRQFAYPCLDWSERKFHLAGGLGAALCQMLISRHFLRRIDGSRQLTLTAKGQQWLQREFSI